MSNTARLNLPLIAAAQAQKHVTHNEALVSLDALVHLAVESRTLASPPPSPVANVRYLVPSTPAGAWTGHAGAIAVEDGGGWIYLQPQTGWMAYARDEGQTIVFNGTIWSPILTNRPAKAVFGSLAVGPQADPSNLCEVRKDQDALTEMRVLNGSATSNAIVRITQAIGRPNAYTVTDIKDNFNNPYWQMACGASIVDAYFDMPRYHFRDSFGSEFVTITSAGRVGIGNPGPGAKLHVSGDIRIENAALSPLSLAVTTGAANEKNWDIAADSATKSFLVRAVADASNASNVALRIERSGYAVTAVSFGASVAPTNDNAFALGKSSQRWTTVFAATGTINTSDARQKTPVRPLDQREADAAAALRNEIGAFQWLDAIAEKGANAARIHIGMTVQRAAEIMTAHGLDPWRYGMFCRDDVTVPKIIKRMERLPKSRSVSEDYFDIEMREGRPVRVAKTRTVTEPVVEMLPVVDENGAAVVEMRPALDDHGQALLTDDGEPRLEAVPLLHPVPVMEDVEVEAVLHEPAGNRLGFRADQLLLFMMRGLA